LIAIFSSRRFDARLLTLRLRAGAFLVLAMLLVSPSGVREAPPPDQRRGSNARNGVG
jgi:hypothetical protein